MSGMNQHNLDHIKDIFERETGVSLTPQPVFPKTKRIVLAAVLVALVFAMAAFTTVVFTPLNGDKLSLGGQYVGNGIIAVTVTNDSSKELRLQEQVKLYKWVGGKEIPLDGEKIIFDETRVEPHSQKVIRIDLTEACDWSLLEQEIPKGQVYYLLLTNRNFLFGHDWMCSFTLTQPEETVQPPEKVQSPPENENPETVPEALRFYFEESFENQLPAFNEANFQYLQRVDELLKRQEERIILPVSPSIMVMGPSDRKDLPGLADLPKGMILDKTAPEDRQYLLTGAEWMTFDTHGHLVGASMEDKVYAICAMMPQYAGETDGGVLIPVRYLAAYRREEIKGDGCIFLHGQLCNLTEMAGYVAYEDEKFTFYDVTHLFYTDLEKHIDQFLATRTDLYCDDGVRERIRNVCNYYGRAENVEMKYPENP